MDDRKRPASEAFGGEGEPEAAVRKVDPMDARVAERRATIAALLAVPPADSGNPEIDDRIAAARRTLARAAELGPEERRVKTWLSRTQTLMERLLSGVEKHVTAADAPNCGIIAPLTAYTPRVGQSVYSAIDGEYLGDFVRINDGTVHVKTSMPWRPSRFKPAHCVARVCGSDTFGPNVAEIGALWSQRTGKPLDAVALRTSGWSDQLPPAKGGYGTEVWSYDAEISGRLVNPNRANKANIYVWTKDGELPPRSAMTKDAIKRWAGDGSIVKLSIAEVHTRRTPTTMCEVYKGITALANCVLGRKPIDGMDQRERLADGCRRMDDGLCTDDALEERGRKIVGDELYELLAPHVPHVPDELYDMLPFGGAMLTDVLEGCAPVVVE